MARRPGLSAGATAMALAVAGTLWLAACGGSGDSGGPAAPADTLPPLLTGIAITDFSSESASIEWLTDEASDSQVIYGTTGAYGRYTPLDPELVTSHRVTVRGLSPSTTYHLRARSHDAAGNLTTSVDVPVTTPAAFLILATDTGRNLTMFKALGTGLSVQTPIPPSGLQSSFQDMDLGEMHFANGRAFMLFTEAGPTNPSPTGIPSGGIHVVNLTTQETEDRFSLPSTLTGRETRPSHASLDPEGKFLWVHNDGPINDPGADSVFRVNVNPLDIDPNTGISNYLTYLEVLVGNGHQTGAFSRPSNYSALTRRAKKLFVVASQDDERIDVIDDDATSATYGQVVKKVSHTGAAPHGMAYSTVSGHVYIGLTDGGMLILDTTATALLTDADVDLANEVDASIKTIPAGTGVDQIPRAGYTHVSADGKTVFTVGYDGVAGKGYLSAIDASDHDRVIKVLELGDVAAGSIDEKSGDKLYLPSTNAGSDRNSILVVDIADPTSPTYLLTVLRTITVGVAGDVRDGEISLNGQLAIYPDTCPACNTVRVIDTATDRVIDTLTLTGPASSTVGMVMVPFTSKDNH